jgi:hypothetical protein
MVEAATDRLGSVARIGSSGPVPAQPWVLSDLSVDASSSPELMRGRLVIYVDVRLRPGVRPHRGLRDYIKRHLRGRNPAVFEERGYLRTGFAIEDHTERSLGRARLFGSELRELLESDECVVSAVTLPGQQNSSLI